MLITGAGTSVSSQLGYLIPLERKRLGGETAIEQRRFRAREAVVFGASHAEKALASQSQDGVLGRYGGIER